MARSYKTEAVVLRSFRFGEADRVLHLYTADRGRVGAVAKGVRKTKSRFGARLEPLSHVELMLHQGSGELHTVTGASLVDPHRPSREDPYRLSVGLVGAEAMLRLFVEQERNERAFEAVTRFLSVLDTLPAGLRGRAALDPLALAFQLKLLWLSGYFPHLESVCRVRRVRRTSSATCRVPAAPSARLLADETVELTPEGLRGVLAPRLEPARGGARAPAGRARRRATRCRRRELVRVPRRLPAASTLVGVRRDLGDGYELDDDPARIDVDVVHRYLSEERTGRAGGRAR